MADAYDPNETLRPEWTADGHLDDGTIHTWLDGAFDAASSAEVNAHVEGCAVCSAAVAEARGFTAGASRMLRALDASPSGVVPPAEVERVASLIVAAARRMPVAAAPMVAAAAAPAASTAVAAASVAASAAASAGGRASTAAKVRARRAWYQTPSFRAAAALVVVLGGSTYVFTRRNVATNDGSSEVRTARADSVRVDNAPAVARAVAPTVASADAPAPAVAGNAATSDQRVLGAAKKAAPAAVAPSVSAPLREAADRRSRVADAATPAATVAPMRAAAALDSLASPPTSQPTAPPASPRPTAPNAASGSAGRVTLAAPPVAAERAMKAMAAPMAAPMPPSTPLVCWNVSVNSAGEPMRLPVVSAEKPFDAPGRYRASWLQWPRPNQQTSVQYELDGAGVLRVTGAADGVEMTMSLTRQGANWSGVATQRVNGARLERDVRMVSLGDAAMCKM